MSDLPPLTPSQLLQKITQERKLKGLTTQVVARQTRLRQEFLVDLEDKNKQPNPNFSISELRQIQLLAKFLKLEFDQKNWYKLYLKTETNSGSSLFFKNKNQKSISKNFNFIFTFTNLNFLIFGLITIVVVVLVGLPAFLVVRPAEILWDSNVQNNTIVIEGVQKIVSGHTVRAKTMIFGGEEILLKNGEFTLDLPKPDRPVVVQAQLTNYFNLITEYNIVIK